MSLDFLNSSLKKYKKSKSVTESVGIMPNNVSESTAQPVHLHHLDVLNFYFLGFNAGKVYATHLISECNI